MKKYSQYSLIFGVILVYLVGRRVYKIFYADTSIQTNRPTEFVLPAAEIELYLDMDGDELLSDDSQKVGVES
jgi:preprotein translocase subunit Sec63